MTDRLSDDDLRQALSRWTADTENVYPRALTELLERRAADPVRTPMEVFETEMLGRYTSLDRLAKHTVASFRATCKRLGIDPDAPIAS